MSRKFMKNQETRITGKWDEYMRRASHKLMNIIGFETSKEMRKHNYITSKTQKVKTTRMMILSRELFIQLISTFEDIPLKANINVTEEEKTNFEDYRDKGSFSIVCQIPSHVSSLQQ